MGLRVDIIAVVALLVTTTTTKTTTTMYVSTSQPQGVNRKPEIKESNT
jgi:hypothetical protein